MFVGALTRRAREHFVTYGGCCWCSAEAAAASGGQSGGARRRRPVDYGVGSGGSGGGAHTQCVRLSYCRVSFNVSREHSPGLSASRACKAFALSGAKHAVPLFRFRLRLKPDSKILCRDVGQDARKSTYGVCYSRLDVARCRTFCQVSLSGLPCAFLGAGGNLRKGLVQPPGLVLRVLISADWLNKSVRRRQQVGRRHSFDGRIRGNVQNLGSKNINM
jgi:hypothetical protein